MEEKDLVRIRQAAFQLMNMKDKVANMQAELEKRERELHEFEFNIVPDLMHELGVEKITLDGDISLSLGSYFRASIPEKNKEKAMKWLRDNGFEDLIKREIRAKFSRGEDKKAEKLAAFLTKSGMGYDDVEQVHHMTLTAFVKEQIEGGNASLPLDLLGAFVGERATVKVPKENTRG